LSNDLDDYTVAWLSTNGRALAVELSRDGNPAGIMADADRRAVVADMLAQACRDLAAHGTRWRDSIASELAYETAMRHPHGTDDGAEDWITDLADLTVTARKRVAQDRKREATRRAMKKKRAEM